MTGPDEELYPKNINNNYAGRFADGFRECLGCESVTHLFRKYPDKNKKSKIFQDLWARVPHTRLRDEQPTSHSNHLYVQPLTSSSRSNPPPNKSPIKRSRFCAIFAMGNHVSPSSQKPMPIPINNSLPSIFLHLGSVDDEENQMHMLLDTGAAMDSGTLAYHL